MNSEVCAHLTACFRMKREDSHRCETLMRGLLVLHVALHGVAWIELPLRSTHFFGSRLNEFIVERNRRPQIVQSRGDVAKQRSRNTNRSSLLNIGMNHHVVRNE